MTDSNAVFDHLPVLYEEALAALNLRSGGCYLDATFGRGGHSAGMLKALGDEGRLLALDKDPEAIEAADSRFAVDSRFEIHQASFAEVGRVLESDLSAEYSSRGFDGILMDLGVSSPQLDNPDRGFSFRLDGPLDMRMDASTGETASEWLSQVSEQRLKQVLKEYGEERFSGRVATAIVQAAKEDGSIECVT